MSEFNSKLSFYIPMVFPKHANVDFVREAFHDAQIGEVSHVVFKRNGKKYYKAYVYFNWIENELAYGIQSELTNYKQTYFTFNNHIRNGYWIVKKNKKEDIEEKNKNILVSCYESIIKDQSVEIASRNRNVARLEKELSEKNSAYHELFENNCKLRELLCDKVLELYTANSFVDLRESMLAETETKLAETETKLAEAETKLAKSQKRLKKTKSQLEKSVSEMEEMMEEHETDVEFFENKISDFKSRIEQLEAYFEEDETEHVDSDSDEREDEEETEDEEQTDEDEEQAEQEEEAEQEEQAEQQEEEEAEAEQEEQAEQEEEAEAEKAEAEETKEERIVKEDALSVILSAYDEDEEEEENDFIVL